MNKSAKIAVGIVVAVGAISTAGAWYTGTRLEGELRTAIEDANHQIKSSLNGFDGSMTLDLVSLDRHVFSSTAHYRVSIKSPQLGKGNENIELLFVDNVEHGPLPWSRLKSLNVMPVMVTSNYSIEKNATTEKWFAMTNGAAPIKGHTTIGYDRSTQGTVEMLPLEINSAAGIFKFSGLNLQVLASADAEKLNAVGQLDDMQITLPSEDGAVTLATKGLSFNTGGTKGGSGFYLGHSDFKTAAIEFSVAGKPPLLIKDLVSTSLIQEERSHLSAQMSYDIAMINYGGKDIGAAQMLWKFSNFEVASTQALYTLYQQTIQRQQAAAIAKEPFSLRLSTTDQALMNAELAKLLAGKPHLELEKLSLRTTNGESRFSFALDLTNPGPLEQPTPDLIGKMLTTLDAKLVISKPMVKDLSQVGASLEGQTDPAIIEQQAQTASETVGAMAVMSQLAKVEGDNVVSSLQYADGKVDFNGQKMTGSQFVNLISNRFGALSEAAQ